MRFIFFLFSISLSVVYSQVKINCYFNPYVIQYGNLNNSSIEYSSSNFRTNFIKKPSQHFGVDVIFLKNKKYNFLFGTQHVTNYYRMDMSILNPTEQFIISSKTVKYQTNSLGFKIGLVRTLNSMIDLDVKLGFWATYKPKDHFLIINHDVSSTGLLFHYNYKIAQGGFYPQLFIPEFAARVNLFKGFCITLGTQLKFYDLDKESGYIDVTAVSYNIVDHTTTYPMHQSRLKRKEFNYFIGVSYMINYNKQKDH